MSETLNITTTTHSNGVVEIHGIETEGVLHEYGNTDLVMCGHCGRVWDDTVSTAYTPTPGGRCPFEYEHEPSRQERVEVVHEHGHSASEMRDSIIRERRKIDKLDNANYLLAHALTAAQEEVTKLTNELIVERRRLQRANRTIDTMTNLHPETYRRILEGEL